MSTRRTPRSRRSQSAPPAGSATLLTLPEVLDELKVARSTFYGWLQYGRGPKCIRYPNNQLRIRRSDLDSWLAEQEVHA